MEFDFPMIFNSKQYSILKAASKSAKAMIKYLWFFSHWKTGFFFYLFYQQVAVIFTCSRLLQDATYSYLPLYLTKTQGFEKVRKTNIFSAFPPLLFIITFSLIYFLACRKESHYITLNTKDACGQRNKCSVANLNKPNGLGLPSPFLQLTSLPPISQASAKNNKPTLAGCEKLARGSEPIGNREIFLNE